MNRFNYNIIKLFCKIVQNSNANRETSCTLTDELADEYFALRQLLAHRFDRLRAVRAREQKIDLLPERAIQFVQSTTVVLQPQSSGALKLLPSFAGRRELLVGAMHLRDLLLQLLRLRDLLVAAIQLQLQRAVLLNHDLNHFRRRPHFPRLPLHLLPSLRLRPEMKRNEERTHNHTCDFVRERRNRRNSSNKFFGRHRPNRRELKQNAPKAREFNSILPG